MRKRGRIAAGAASATLVVLALAQVLLPRLAANRISSRVARFGKVVSVSVSAWPAIELLWGDAGSVHVHVEQLKASPTELVGLLWEGRGASSVEASAENVQIGSLHLSRASLSKHGSSLSADAIVSEAAVRAALPAGFAVRLLRSQEGEVEVQATGALFGIGASVNALATASEGKLVAHPVGLLVDALQLTLFSSPHVYVEGVGASVESERPLSYQLSMSARLR